MRYLFYWCIKFYQFAVSPLIGPKCRFYPSCSNYSIECLQKFSISKALWYSIRRILKCHPFHPGGHDPVP